MFLTWCKDGKQHKMWRVGRNVNMFDSECMGN